MNPGKRRGRVAALGVRRRPVVKSDLQQDELHADHDEGLDQESSIVFRSGIVEDPVEKGRLSDLDVSMRWIRQPGENIPHERRNQHDERNVERKPGAGPVAVHGISLVAVRQERREDEKGRGDVPGQCRQPPHLCCRY
jgi:hypothetical protein